MITLFKVKINGNEPVDLTVNTSIYIQAVAAIPAFFKTIPPLVEGFVVERYGDIAVEIWREDLIPHHGPHYFVIRQNEFGQLIVMSGALVQ